MSDLPKTCWAAVLRNFGERFQIEEVRMRPLKEIKPVVVFPKEWRSRCPREI